MSRPPKPTYKTTNWPAYNQALKQRGSLTVWFDPSMQWDAVPSGHRGRQHAYSDAAIQACLTLKILLGLPLRQGVPLSAIGPRAMARGFMASLLELSGLGWSVPDFSTLSRRQMTLDVTIPFRGSKGALHLLIDSTGIKVEGEGCGATVAPVGPRKRAARHTRKHGGSKRKVWRKIHLGIDEQTLEIRTVEVTSSNVGDAPMLPDLLAQIPAEEKIATVTADGAYDTRACHDAIAARGAAAVRRAKGPPDLLLILLTSAPPHRQALEAGHGRSSRTQRDPAGIEAPGPGALAELERVPSPQQGRNENELREAARAEADGPRLRPPGGRGPDPGGGPEPLHCPRNPDDRGRRISVSGERGIAVIS